MTRSTVQGPSPAGDPSAASPSMATARTELGRVAVAAQEAVEVLARRAADGQPQLGQGTGRPANQ